ncbi:FHA domain-containing protein [Slackia heliotrinireducens]|uniref:FHA domain-containing protein n=1 Tax=Slackia heliotrinireducens (strain ATCC 29202 / DSM 20476 / NCTC 11029 / RHS 1) TaxID=471855 RepID=C7N3Y0_SLAHD|nr:FHA domain-containing protein [Slackia heliotrinireducens]ACV21721.1 hypothetical protein Shel_06620 [Slackia heliotrinireducens DSM 20476]VEG99363.1 FHA domain [Slackia heliotrinireducens]
MAVDNETPCGVLFDTFKGFAGISNRDVAVNVLSDRPIAGGRSLQQRADDKSFLSRSIVHSKPGDLPASAFVPFDKAAYALFSAMRSSQGRGLSVNQISDHFSGDGALAMADACRNYQLNDVLYLNAVQYLKSASGANDVDRAYLLVLLFVETGLRQDPRIAAEHVLSMAERAFGSKSVTQTSVVTDLPQTEEDEGFEDVRLALFRVVGNRMRGSAYVLNTDDEGTEIGYLATAANSIADVEQTVSRHHLLIYRNGEGVWYARGLNSRNGSVLVSGEDRTRTVIEPPRDQRGDGYVAQDVRLQAGDRLELARDTVFMIVQVDA